MLILIFGITAVVLLFPSLSNHIIFAKGEFTYPESIGFIFLYITLILLVFSFISKKYKNIIIKKPLIKVGLFSAVIGINIFALLFVITFVWLRFDVKTHCKNAIRDYGGNCTEALTRLLNDEKQNVRVKNSAIWTLGQRADKQALPILKSLYTGEIPEKESLDKTISQYELKKAIRWCEEGNITSWMY